MAVGGHFSKWRPRATRPGFEMSTLVIFIGKALFDQNQVRLAVLWESLRVFMAGTGLETPDIGLGLWLRACMSCMVTMWIISLFMRL